MAADAATILDLTTELDTIRDLGDCMKTMPGYLPPLDALAGVADVFSAKQDRNPFGLYDMAGNVAEFSDTLGSQGGETGWFVMGGSYASRPADALVHRARVVPGWMPVQGVGFRCVREIK